MLRITSIKMSLLILTSVSSLAPIRCLAAIKGDVELLKTVALRNKANFESILTWKGEAFEERVSTIGDWYDYMMKNKCTFAYDQLQNAVRWNKYPEESRCINHGKPQIDILANNNSAMFKDQSYYEYTGFKQPDDKNKVTYHLAIADPKMAQGKHDESLDPRYLFADAAGSPVYGKLMFLYNNANVEGPFDYYVKREGDLVTLQVSPDETRTLKEVYDLAAGGNMVERYSKTAKAENTRINTYEEKSGVWVLKSHKWMNVTFRKNGEVTKLTRTLNWSNSVVNVPFKDDEFTVEKLGVKYGDMVSDHRIGMSYIYGGYLRDSELLEAVDTGVMPTSEISGENDMVPAPNDVDATQRGQADNEANAVSIRHMLSDTMRATPNAHEIRRYAFAIIAAVVVGLAVIAYILIRRLGKE